MKSRWSSLVKMIRSASAKVTTSHHSFMFSLSGSAKPADSTQDGTISASRSSPTGATRAAPRTSWESGSENSATHVVSGRACLYRPARKWDAARGVGGGRPPGGERGRGRQGGEPPHQVPADLCERAVLLPDGVHRVGDDVDRLAALAYPLRGDDAGGVAVRGEAVRGDERAGVVLCCRVWFAHRPRLRRVHTAPAGEGQGARGHRGEQQHPAADEQTHRRAVVTGRLR